MYDFLESGKDRELVIRDHINNEEVPAREYFKEFKNSFDVKRQRLPYDLTVKAAYINKTGKNSDRPILELAEIDFDALEAKLTEDGKNPIRIKGKSVFYFNNTCMEVEKCPKLIQTKTSNKYKRSQAVFTPGPEDPYNIDWALQVAESMWNGNTFKEDPKLAREVNRAMKDYQGKPELKQIQVLKQLLEEEQVGKLRLEYRVSPQQVLKSEIMTMSTSALIEKMANEAEDIALAEGLIANILRRRAITRIKNSVPGLTWAKATELYSRLANKSGGGD